MTGYFSAELPVRHFLADFPDETMKAVDAWSRDEDFRVRRLASEATRPLLPWAPRIALSVDAGLPILETLYDDPHLYVRTSVANHLRGIAATQPDLVLTTLQRWQASGRVTGEQFAFLARNALSNRLKEGWPPAYALLGYAHDAPIALTPLVLERTDLRESDTLNFSASRTATATVPVHVMIVIASTGPSGRPREKVAFLRRATVEPGQELRLTKAHPLRSTARWKVSPGSYSLALQVNGRRFPAVAFTVLDA
ncbi:DNA alkylation repair protein [Streptomyces sennicomposti]